MIKMTVQDLQDMIHAQVETVVILRNVSERCDKQDDEITRLGRSLQQVDQDYADLQYKLDDLQRRPVPRNAAVTNHGLLMDLLHTPHIFQALADYMRAAPLGEKIAQIKRVRELTSWGLKEAKDFVEAYDPAPGALPTIGEMIRDKLIQPSRVKNNLATLGENLG